jgi:hypothetical protein
MTKLKMIVPAAAALIMTGIAAAPTMAQPYGYDHGGYRGGNGGYAGRHLTSSYVDSLEWRINNAAQQGQISGREAGRLIGDLRQIQGPMIYRVENGQASNGEVRHVSNVVSRIESETSRYADNGRRYR